MIGTCNCLTKGIECDMHPTQEKGIQEMGYCTECSYDEGICWCDPKQDTQDFNLDNLHKMNNPDAEVRTANVQMPDTQETLEGEDRICLNCKANHGMWWNGEKSVCQKCFKANFKYIDPEVKAFIKKEREEAIASKPKGISAWREEGKKLGHWKYFEEIAYKEGYEARDKRCGHSSPLIDQEIEKARKEEREKVKLTEKEIEEIKEKAWKYDQLTK